MRAALVLVPPADRGLVRAGAQALCADLRQWARMVPGHADDRMVERLSAIVAAVAPRLPPARLALLARYALWAVLLDDRLDAPAADPDRLRDLRDRVRDVLGTGGAPGDDRLCAALADLVARFRAAGGDPALLEAFTAALRDAVRAGVDQAVLHQQVRAGRRPPPAVGEYLVTATRDVNYRSFAYAVTLLTGARPGGAALQAIDRALTPASRAVRLANDLRSVHRDRAAGRFNVLTLRQDHGAPVHPGAVRRAIHGEVRRHDGLLRAAGTAGHVATLTNSLHVAVGVYRLADVR